MVSTKLSQEDLDQIERAVQKAEATTRGEIVAVIVPRSQSYRWVPFFLSGFMAVLATAVVILPIEWSASQWGPSLEALVMIQLTGALLGAVLSQIPAVRRFVVPRLQLDASVENQARAEFVRQGVMNTNDRCGVLLLVSLFEHRVQLIADRGIHSVVDEGYWAEETRRLASEIRSTHQLRDAIVHSVERLGVLLANRFPRTADTVNELSDRPRLS